MLVFQDCTTWVECLRKHFPALEQKQSPLRANFGSVYSSMSGVAMHILLVSKYESKDGNSSV
jgi:hypothetical protein